MKKKSNRDLPLVGRDAIHSGTVVGVYRAPQLMLRKRIYAVHLKIFPPAMGHHLLNEYFHYF